MKATATEHGPLVVRRRLWHQRADEQPKTEILTLAGWKPVKGYDEARAYAAEHGYEGIRIRML